jgi:NTE family protein
VGTAVSASAAVPSYFRPVVIGGHRFVDGGCHSPVNADAIADMVDDLDAVVVSAPMGMAGRPHRRGGDIPGRALNHLFGWWELGPARAAGLAVSVFEPTATELEVMHYNAFDRSHAGDIASRARATAGALLASQPDTEDAA